MKLIISQVRHRRISALKQVIEFIRTSAITINSHEGSLGVLAKLFPRIDVAHEADEPEVRNERGHGAETGWRCRDDGQ